MVKKALILAAGLGSRLQENTTDIPKALVQVGGKPFMQYQLEALEKNGIEEVSIVVGYKKEKIKEFIANNDFNLKINIVDNDEYDSSNSAVSFYKAKDFVKDEPYIHLNCDVLFSPNLIKRVIESDKDNVIVYNPDADLTKCTEHVILDGERIKTMGFNGLENEAVGKGNGIAKISPENLKEIIKGIEERVLNEERNEHFYGVIRGLLDKLEFYGLSKGDDFIREVNTIEDLEIAENAIGELK